MDDSEIIGKAVKDIEGMDFQETRPVLMQKKYLILGLIVTVLLIIIAGIVRIYMCETSESPTQAGQLNEDEGFVTFKEQVKEPVNQQQENQQPVNQQTPADDIIYYKVQEGDCFEKIAIYYYGTESYASELARYNKIDVDSILSIGQTIKAPKETDKLKQ
ncbi:LysM peptidoglycan-binding domain-containing protein [Pelotomaculum isophthalicicum JI]|uniref:LysM peptidoglycan-binding domain-containing protein n=2 Tax=Pelotomaculum TaxID=191373 RepID=A0A9X4H0B7_9FIRM|nr:LysM domain-containing protein [Pelotomaculum isophthalicicum]MDF9407176.1 LysM peptidoglycan-binding domain-containing protein [Pelotomaculum isophthalicicum JI]